MPIHTQNLDNGLGNFVLGYGDVTETEYLESLKKHLNQKEDIILKYRYNLTDFRNVEKFDVSTKAINAIADYCKQSAAINPEAIVAIVAPQELIFGLSRMWEVLTEDTGWEITVFKEINSAKSWIKERVLAKYGINNLSFK